MSTTAYLAADGFLDELVEELPGSPRIFGRLAVTDAPPIHAAWAANVWYEPETLAVRSVSDASRQLRARQRRWAAYSFRLHRRVRLVQEALPRVPARPVPFPSALPTAPLGSFTLLEPNLLLAAARCRSPFPNGEIAFAEDRRGPPNRAYLKLWEAFLRFGERPTRGQTCLDLGASPGGWTWALARLGATVISVDKAPLDARIERLAGVSVLRQSAFALSPRDVGAIDFWCCDVVAYPARLLALARKWVEAGTAERMLCTIKLQGATDHDAVRSFAAIPGSIVTHLHHNRHELTWWWRKAALSGAPSLDGLSLAK